ncbi:uncharacterized protein LOC127561365 [Antechinus flavipes]|uniref:uncharacterized protein LOC127561365 n=1 Tax=Antechinus flavipes TaxID=38775 RepID=UPI0022354F1A|nr:uncharacterized protein LOC127561365 [Antechinus flavipes]
MGIELTEEELEELKKHLPIDVDEKVKLVDSIQDVKASGKVDIDKLLDEVKAIQGKKVAITDIDNFLENVGIELSDQEFQELMKNLPADGGKINIQNLDDFLGNMGIKIIDEDLKELKKNLPVDDHGKTDLSTLINEVKALQGGDVDINNLDNILENLGIKLTDKESEELLSHLPVDADGKVSLNEVLDKVKSIKENIDAQNLKDFLKDMGIILTEDEYEDLLKDMPIDRGKIHIDNLHKVLGKMVIQLTDKEMEELLNNLPVDANGNVALNEVMDKVKSIKENIDVQNLKDFMKDMGIILTEDEYQDLRKDLSIDGGKINIDNLDKMGIQLTDKEMEELLNNLPVDADGNVALNEVMDKVKSIKENIDAQNLKDFLKDMGIILTEDEYQDLLKDLPIDGSIYIETKTFSSVIKEIPWGDQSKVGFLVDRKVFQMVLFGDEILLVATKTGILQSLLGELSNY